jgi:hypothetical protein
LKRYIWINADFDSRDLDYDYWDEDKLIDELITGYNKTVEQAASILNRGWWFDEWNTHAFVEVKT